MKYPFRRDRLKLTKELNAEDSQYHSGNQIIMLSLSNHILKCRRGDSTSSINIIFALWYDVVFFYKLLLIYDIFLFMIKIDVESEN